MKLLELAATWEEWAASASRLADHAEPTTAAALRAKAEQAIEDATALRNHVADHPEETQCNPR
jgi:hypothetical protein